MTKYNWNYEALGFESEAEMKESIERVERRSKMSSFELEQERYDKVHNGNINFEELEAGVRRNELDRLVQNKMQYERQQAHLKAERDKFQSLFNKASDNMAQENKVKAQKELEEAKTKVDAELQKEIYSKHSVKTDEEQARDELFRSMLKDLK